MPLTPEEYTFDPGVDFTALFGGYASALTSNTQLQQPNSEHGMTLYRHTPPIVSGTYFGGPANWFDQNKRYTWIDPVDGSGYGYKTGVGWVNFATNIPANTVTTAMLQDHCITLAKLAVGGGAGTAAGNTFLVNGANNAWVYGDPIVARADNTIPVAKLVAGSEGQLVSVVGGISSWYTLTGTKLNTIFAVGPRLDPTNIDGSAGAPGWILRVNSTSTYADWEDPAGLFLPNTIPIAAMQVGSGTAGQIAQINSTGTGWQYATLPTALTVVQSPSGDLAIPAAGAAVTFAHTLGAVPTTYTRQFRCTTAENGYSVGDYIDPASVIGEQATNAELPAFAFLANTTNIVMRRNSTAGALLVMDAGTGSPIATFNPAHWVLNINAIKIS